MTAITCAAINRRLAKKYDGKLIIEKGETVYFTYDDEPANVFVTESQWGIAYLNQLSLERWLELADQFYETRVKEAMERYSGEYGNV